MKKIFKNIQYEKYYRDILPYLKKDKNQQYFAVIITLGASIFFALFAINPTLSTIVKLRKDVTDSREVEAKLSAKITNLSSLSQAYQDITDDIPYVLNAIPPKPEAPTLIAQIQSIAQASSVSISDVKTDPIILITPDSTQSSSLYFDLSAKSDFEGLSIFVSKLTNMERVVSIDSISISKTEGEIINLSINIKGSAYYKK